MRLKLPTFPIAILSLILATGCSAEPPSSQNLCREVIVVDLKGLGFEALPTSARMVSFDIDRDGKKETVTWPPKDYGFLLSFMNSELANLKTEESIISAGLFNGRARLIKSDTNGDSTFNKEDYPAHPNLAPVSPANFHVANDIHSRGTLKQVNICHSIESIEYRLEDGNITGDLVCMNGDKYKFRSTRLSYEDEDQEKE